MRQDHQWVARCADLASNKPVNVEKIGKIIEIKTKAERLQAREDAQRDSMRRGSMSLSSSTKRDRSSQGQALMRDKQNAKVSDPHLILTSSS